MKNNRIVIFAIVIGMFLGTAYAQDGQQLFNDNCTACHKLGGKLVGPDLVGVTDRRNEEWIKAFVTNSKALIESGDKDAKAIFDEYNQTEMTVFQGAFTDEELTALVDYLKVAKAPEPVASATTVDGENDAKVVLDAPLKPMQIVQQSIVFMYGFVVVMVLFMIMYNVSKYLNEHMTEEEKNSSFSNKFFAMFAGDWRLFTGNYTESSTEGHEYDGIRELDNIMPPWLQGIFYLTIAFAIGYLINYQVINPENTQKAEYEREMAAAAEKYGNMDIVRIPIVKVEDATKLDAAKEAFASKCVACHLADGGGSVGPNLTDEYWINGGSLEEVFNTIRKGGRPGKGMQEWKGIFTDEEILALATYVKNFKGTTPAKGKEPQGEKYTE